MSQVSCRQRNGRKVRYSVGRLPGSVIQGLDGGMSARSHETVDRRDLGLGRRRNVATHKSRFDCLWVCVRLWCFDRAAVGRRQCTVLHANTPQSATPTQGSHDEAKGKVKGAEGKDGQLMKVYGPLATQPFRSARAEGEPHRQVSATTQSRHVHKGEKVRAGGSEGQPRRVPRQPGEDG